MRASSYRVRRLLVLGCAVSAVLGSASIAEAQFTSGSSAGSMSVATRTLNAPGSFGATATCVKNVSIGVDLSWTASNFATGYQIYRQTGGIGAYSLLASVGSGTTSYTDSTVAFSTAYSYYVLATFQSWTASSSTSAATTLSKVCH